MKSRRAGLFLKYFAIIGLLVSLEMIVSGAIGLHFSYQETRQSLVNLQREKAVTAAVRIEQFLRDIERQLGWTAMPTAAPGQDPMESRRLDFTKLLRQVPAITEVSHLDGQGREQLKVSRLAMNSTGSNIDFSKDPRFIEARKGKTWFGPVYFRKETEPYMAISIPEARDRPGATVVDVNLKFIGDVISRIRIGQKGYAYVVDDKGFLVAHPEMSLVLKKVNLSTLPQVQEALAAGLQAEWREPTDARNLEGEAVFSAWAPIGVTGWRVFVEEPQSEVFAPMYDAILRTIFLLIGGLVVSVLASLFLARRMVTPVRALQQGAERIGAGDLDGRIDVRTGDELEDLAARFNNMAAQLKESYAGLERKVDERTAELREALSQQTATAEILRVISSSPTDVQPVFQAIVNAAKGLGEARSANMTRFDGEFIQSAAFSTQRKKDKQVPWRPSRSSLSGRVILSGAAVEIRSLNDDPEYDTGRFWFAGDDDAHGVGVPMLREGVPIGVLNVWWSGKGSVPDKYIRLLQTFADQAVIAIENVRLFHELEGRNQDLSEALSQQTATSEILRVISSSPTDVQPVFDAIVKAAKGLGGGAGESTLTRYDGELIYYAADTRQITKGERVASWLPSRSSLSGRVVLAKAPVAIPSLRDDPEYDTVTFRFEDTNMHAVGVPLLREGVPIGVLNVWLPGTGTVPEKFVRVLQMLAAQAVIAIENVRLFSELQDRNRDLGEALGQQTATGEILSVISSSPTELTPVFEAIVRAAKELGQASRVTLCRYDGELLRHGAGIPGAPGYQPAPWRPDASSLSGRVVLAKEVVQIRDLREDPHYDIEKFSSSETERPSRGVGVPMLREGIPVGVLNVWWNEPGEIPDKYLRLLQTFADQAVIAIENVRLFNEIRDTSRELEAANRHKSEFLANMSHELRTPLNAIIGFSDVMLGGMAGKLKADQKEFITDIRDSGRHLLTLINDILDLSKIEAGRMELDVARFDIPMAIDNAMTLIRGRADRNGIRLESDISSAVDSYEGDERKFKQIVLNLLSNAVKFTPEGGTVTLAAARANGAYVVSVKDTGVGIAPEDQERIFEEFRQVGTDYARKAEGTGLGLTLTRKLVELHGGSLRVESALGQGSTFTFTLPIATQ
jgi:two-component system, NtrC family, sensor kinase